MSATLQYFEENLPHRPYHTDDLAFGLRISGKGRVLLTRYIQRNQPHAQFWLIFGVDREGAMIDWNDRSAPVPDIIVKSSVNGHAHLLYTFNIAVRTVPNASTKALKYAAAIERSLREKLCTDVNHSDLICRNSFHLEWLVMEQREEAYTLNELADHLGLSASVRRNIDKHYGIGRNCHLFETTRKWTYRVIHQGWPKFPQRFDAVTQRAEMYNISLPVPSSPAEYRAIGRSIAKYAHRKLSPEGFFVVQAAHDHRGGIAKGEAYKDKRSMALYMPEDGYSQKAITAMLNVHRGTICNWAVHKQPHQITTPFRWFFEQLFFGWFLLVSPAMVRLFV